MPNEKPRKFLAHAVLLLVPMCAAVVSCGGCGESSSDKPSVLSNLDGNQIEQHGQLYFVKDVRAGLRLASEQQVPCLFFFTAEWCTFCHHMAETAFIEPAVGDLGRNFVCILVDADRNKDLCQYFSISGFPTVEFTSPQGHSLHRLVGQQSPESLAAGMRAALGRYAWVSGTQVR